MNALSRLRRPLSIAGRRCASTISMGLAKDAPINIVGAGAWGLSTALHLNASGYTNITVFDRANTVPSPHSAAWDLNKIVRAEYEDVFYTKLALEAIEGWKTPLFGPYYHQTGYVVAATGRAPAKAIKHLEAALASIEKDPIFAPGIRRLNSAQDFKDYTWQYTGPLSGFKGYYNRLAGYAHSSDALQGIWSHCARQGVRFVFGERAGHVKQLNYTSSPLPSYVRSTSVHSNDHEDPYTPSQRCTGLTTVDGRRHPAALTICALGAHAASLVPSMADFTVARSWSVAHIQLTDAEADWLRGIPTTNVRDLGFFFEPDPKTKLFKLCPLGAGFTNTDYQGVSLPPSPSSAPHDYIPRLDEEKLRQLLRETFPWMADRPFVDKKICWFNDTADSEFVIDYVPDTANSVICLGADSGHGFKMMPVFGKWVKHLIEDGQQTIDRWRWKATGDVEDKDWAGSVSWRIGEGKEISEIVAEQRTMEAARAKL